MTEPNACQAPRTKGPLKGHSATGSRTGYFRHVRAGEAVCAACRKAQNLATAQWRIANPEKLREGQLDYNRRRYAANPEKVQAVNRRWRESNPEKARAIDRRWRLRNPEKILAKKYRARVRKAGTAPVVIPFTAQQLAQRMAYWGDKCWMCGGSFEAVDHVIAVARGGPHCLSNLRPACQSCNSSKGFRTLSDT